MPKQTPRVGVRERHRPNARFSEPRYSARQLRILDELEHIFLSEGFLTLSSVDEVARRVRSSKQTLYQLAPNREALYLLVIGRFLENWRRRGDEAIAAATDSVSALTDYLNAGVEETREVSARFLQDVNAYLPAHKLMREHQLIRIAGLEALLEDGVKRKAFNPINPRLVATITLKLIDELIDPDFQNQVGLTMSQLCAQLYELIIHGLAPYADTQAAHAQSAAARHDRPPATTAVRKRR